MNRETVQDSIREAKRFLALAQEVLSDPESSRFIVGTLLTGALRRSSMDLTRALSRLRKSS